MQKYAAKPHKLLKSWKKHIFNEKNNNYLSRYTSSDPYKAIYKFDKEWKCVDITAKSLSAKKIKFYKKIRSE